LIESIFSVRPLFGVSGARDPVLIALPEVPASDDVPLLLVPADGPYSILPVIWTWLFAMERSWSFLPPVRMYWVSVPAALVPDVLEDPVADALPPDALEEPVPDVLPPDVLEEPVPDVPVAEPPLVLLPEVPLLLLMLLPDALPPIVAFARMKWSAFEALLLPDELGVAPAVEVLAAVPEASAGWRQPVTVTFSSDCLPPAWRLLLDCEPCPAVPALPACPALPAWPAVPA